MLVTLKRLTASDQDGWEIEIVALSPTSIKQVTAQTPIRVNNVTTQCTRVQYRHDSGELQTMFVAGSLTDVVNRINDASRKR